jgi:protoporphyrinogen oxidase
MAVTVVEKDTQVGGMARTLEFMGCRFDVGPHPFASGASEIEALLSDILGEQIRPVSRLTRILYRGKFLEHPNRVSNALLSLGPMEAARCLASYARARLKPVSELASFESYLTNRVGHRLFEIFFKTYAEKVSGMSTRQLPADWACERIDGLHRVEVSSNSLLPAAFGGAAQGASIKKQVQFVRYPQRGAGQLWEGMAARLGQAGNAVRLGEEVVAVRHGGGRVLSVVVRDRRGGTLDVLGSEFISTMPIPELIAKLQPAVPSMVRSAAAALGYRDLITVNVVVDRASVFPDLWIYVHDAGVKVGRISNFKNFSREMVSDSGLSGLGMEYFGFETDGLWKMADAELLDLGRRELVALGLCRPDEVKAGMVHRQPKVYPVYDEHYHDHLAVIREWLARALPNLWLVEQNGQPADNQDDAMMAAILVAGGIATGTPYGPGQVNTHAEYEEEQRAGEVASALASGRQGGRAVWLRVASRAAVGGYTGPAVPE